MKPPSILRFPIAGRGIISPPGLRERGDQNTSLFAHGLLCDPLTLRSAVGVEELSRHAAKATLTHHFPNVTAFDARSSSVDS
jgi:hypothetical protein